MVHSSAVLRKDADDNLSSLLKKELATGLGDNGEREVGWGNSRV